MERAPGEALITHEGSHVEVDSSADLLAGSHSKELVFSRSHPGTPFELLLVGQVVDLVDGPVGPEPEEILPDRNASEGRLGVEVAANMEIMEVVKVLSDDDLGVRALMALIAGIVVV